MRKRLAALVASAATLAPLGAVADQETVVLALIHPHPPQVSNADANALFADVNAARRRRHMRPLLRDARLTDFALAIAERMAERHYFGHTDPGGITFADRIRSAGLRFHYAAENMAFDQDEAHAHAAFLRSPPHYANIVDPHPRRLGVAAVSAGDGQIFYVEEFAD